MKNLDFEIFNFLDKSDNFEHFFKILVLKNFTSVLNHFVPKKKIDQDFLKESEYSKHLFKKSIFEKILSVLTHFVWEKIEIFRFCPYPEGKML